VPLYAQQMQSACEAAGTALLQTTTLVPPSVPALQSSV
jgi:hypothetical protein